MAGADMGLGGGYGAGGVSEAIGKILAQRALAQQLAETARSHQADEDLKQQQITEQAKYREMQQQGIQQDRAVNEGARLAGTLSPGDSLLNQPNTVNRLIAGGQGPNIGVVPPLSASPLPSGASVPSLPSGSDAGGPAGGGDVMRTGPSMQAPLQPPKPGEIGNVSWLGTPQERKTADAERSRKSYLRTLDQNSPLYKEAQFHDVFGSNPTASAVGATTAKPGELRETNAGLLRIGPDNQTTPVLGPNGQPLQPFHQPSETQNNSRLDKSYQFNSTQLEKERTPIAAKMDKLQGAAEMLAQRSPQADALVAPQILSVSAGGAGSGLRMNEAEIARIVGGRSKWESLKAALNKWSLDPTKALSITDEQRNEMGAILDAAHSRIKSKLDLLDQAGSDLVNATDVATHRTIVNNVKKKLDALDSGGAPPQAPAGWKYVPKPGGGWTAVKQ